MAGHRLAIIIPCYNEKATIGNVAKIALNFGEVIVIDDGSTDGSDHLVKNLGARVVKTKGNTGYDNAIDTGIKYAFDNGFDYIITIDADGEHDPKHIGEFKKLLEENNDGLICGFRPRPQRLAEWVVCGYVKHKYGIKDILCGMKGYSRNCIKNYFQENVSCLVNTRPALLWADARNSFKQVYVSGERRKDQPRFGSIVQANIRILKMLGPINQIKNSKTSLHD